MPKEKIDFQISKRMEEILNESAALFHENNLRESLQVAEGAWDLIPEPKAVGINIPKASLPVLSRTMSSWGCRALPQVDRYYL